MTTKKSVVVTKCEYVHPKWAYRESPFWGEGDDDEDNWVYLSSTQHAEVYGRPRKARHWELPLDILIKG